MIELLLLMLWVIAGVLTMGWTYGHFQGKWPTLAEDPHSKSNDRMFAIMLGIIAPAGLMVVIINGGYKYGWKPIWK